MLAIISAVPGAGKTTVLDYVEKRIKGIKIINEGDMVLEVAKKKYKIKDRDELRKKLTIDQQREIQKEVAKKIQKMKDKIVLMDTHMAVKTPTGYFPGLSEKIASIIKPDVIFVLEYDPEDILNRREMDPTRHRDVETEEQIEEHQKANREFAFSAAAEAESSVEIINLRFKEEHEYHHAEKAAEKIVEVIRRLIK